MKDGVKAFDGYDPQTNTLTDAKDWSDFPPENQDWAERKIAEQARDDLNIAREAGSKLEWHVPTQQKADQLIEIFENARISGPDIVVTPK